MRRLAPVFLFLVFFLIAVATSSGIGPSWDEPDNIFAGGVYMNFFSRGFDSKILTLRDQSIFGDRIYSQQESLQRYPPVPLLVGSLFTMLVERVRGPLTGPEIIGMFHVTSGMFLGLLAAFVYLWALLLGCSVPLAIVAGLIAGFFPTLFGHGLSNVKDIAQTALFAISLYFLVRSGLRSSYRSLLIGSMIWGLALSTKINAVYVPIIWGVWELGSLIKARKIRDFGPLVLKSLVIIIIGLLTMIVVWPYLWFDPIQRVQEVITYFTTVGKGYKVVWDGQPLYVGDTTAVWWYPLGNLIFSTPLPILLIGLIGAGGALRRNRKILLVWFCIPLIRVFFPYTAFYDGIRHFMEVLPAVAILAAFGIQDIVVITKRPVLLPISMVIIGHLLVINVLYFPYSTGYLNFLAAKQNTHFDRDFSGLAVKEGMDYLKRTYGPINVFAPIGGHLAWYYIGPKDSYVYYPMHADSIIVANKISHITKAEFEATVGTTFKEDYVIRRGNNIFGWVYRRK